MGQSERFRERSVGNPEERTVRVSAIDLPIRPTGVERTPICDEAMDDECCTLFMILPLFFRRFDIGD